MIRYFWNQEATGMKLLIHPGREGEAMSPNDLIGRRVRVTAWEHMNRIAYYLRRTRQYGDSLEGTVTHVEGFADGADEGDVWVQIDGLAREYVFGLYQLEVLPLAGASRQWKRRRATYGGVAISC